MRMILHASTLLIIVASGAINVPAFYNNTPPDTAGEQRSTVGQVPGNTAQPDTVINNGATASKTDDQSQTNNKTKEAFRDLWWLPVIAIVGTIAYLLARRNK